MRRDFIPHVHSNLRTARIGRRGATARPDDVPVGICKEYPRMPRLLLPAPEAAMSLGEALQLRRSHRGIVPRTALSLAQAGALLAGLRERENSTRPYPSGGSLYPIETYLVGAVVDHRRRVFHYFPKAHALEDLWSVPAHFSIYDLARGGKDAGEPPSILVFTSRWERSGAKYGDFSYILSLLEAGHMAQNVLLAAVAAGVGALPLEAFSDDAVHETLDIDGKTEQVVYAIALYPPAL